MMCRMKSIEEKGKKTNDWRIKKMGVKKLTESQYDLGFRHIVKSGKGYMKRLMVDRPNQIDFKDYNDMRDIFYTPNTFSSPVRRTREYLWQLHRLYIDIDLKKGESYLDQYEVVGAIEDLVKNKIIPQPTEYIHSGRGIHVYWDINNCHVMLLDLWERLEEYLYESIKSIEKNIKEIRVDKTVTSPASVLRVPSSINSRNNQKCYSMRNIHKSYDIFELKKLYLPSLKKKNNGSKVVYLPTKNIFTLNASRLEDLENIVALRHYDVKGYRNTLILFYSYHYRLNNEVTLKELISVTRRFNNKFRKPYKIKELEAVCRSVQRTIRLYKKDNTRGYKFSNKYIIEALNITEEEQIRLRTIISKNEKYRRKNEKRYPKNENGLTKKQQELLELKEKVIELQERGLSLRKIAKKLGKSLGTVQNILK